MSEMKAILNGFLRLALGLLPDSPFTSFLDSFADLPYLGFINWFVPIHDALIVLDIWISAVIVFYSIQVILRWVKLIK